MLRNSISEAVLSVFEGVAIAHQKMFQSTQQDYCKLDTSDSDFTMVTKEGSLVSGFYVDGLTSAIGPMEFEDLMEKLTGMLKPFMKEKSYSFQVFASCDKSNVINTLRRGNSGTRKTLEALKLNLEGLLKSRESHLAKFCNDEKQLIAVWTHPDAINSNILKSAREKQKSDIKHVSPEFSKPGIQYLMGVLPNIRDKHEALVRQILNSMGRDKAGFSIRQLTCNEMLREARMAVCPELTPQNWKSCLPGDPIPAILRGDDTVRNLTLADAQYPPISWQIFPCDGKRIGFKYYEMGDRIYAPLYIETPPQQIEPFSNLFDTLNTAGVPWRCSFTIDGGGLSYVAMKGGIASFLSWGSPYNKKMKDSIDHMKARSLNGVSHVRLKVAFVTWADKGDLDTLRSRVAQLVHGISSWGDCEVREQIGNPAAGFYSTVPFISHETMANPAVGPVADIVRMLPLLRQGSHWKQGSITYRTKDGKPIPFEPGSSLQNTWNYILFGPPGSGKSVQMANLLLGMVCQPGITELPRIGLIDIGPSSRGLIELIRSRLPMHLRHQLAFISLRNTEEYSINPFDTFIGCRFPSPAQKAFLTNILVQLSTPAELNKAFTSITDIASQVIDNAYNYFADTQRSKAKGYAYGSDAQVDALLTKLNFDGLNKKQTTWWAVVDFLFAQGYSHEASLAQRHAVPNLSDIASLAMDQTMLDQFGHVMVETRENLCAVFSRMISTATKMFPLIAGKTRFDLGEVKIVAIDIEEVAKSSSATDSRQVELMYLIAKNIVSKNFRIDKKYVESDLVPPLYKDYLGAIARKNKELMKWIVYDEFHRTSKSPSVQNEVLVDMREGRKWNLGVILASQSLTDFPDTFTEFATGVFVLKASTQDVVDRVQHLFNLNDTTAKLMKQFCNGADNKLGAPMLLHLLLTSGATDMLVYSTIGPEELWSFSTTAEDFALRERVTLEMEEMDPENGAIRTISMLAKIFPVGAKSKIESLKLSMGKTDDDNGDKGIIENLAQQVIKRIKEESSHGMIY